MTKGMRRRQLTPAEWQALADLPHVVQHVLAQHGFEAMTFWQPDAPQTAPGTPWDAGAIDPDKIPPCLECGSLEQWQSMAGNWRCMRCAPPRKSNLIQRKAARFRRLAEAAP